MSSKFSILPVIIDQYSTFTDAHTGRPRFEDYFVVLAIPIGLGAWSVLSGGTITIVGELISAIAIITSLLFGLVVFIFQLRVQLGAKDVAERVPMSSVQLIDEMFKNVAYAIVIGFAATALLLLGAAVRDESEQAISVALSGAIVVLLAHFVLTLAMCLKRLTKAYDRVARL